MRENCTSGSVEGAAGDRCPYSDPWIRDRRAERGSGPHIQHWLATSEPVSRSDMPLLVGGSGSARRRSSAKAPHRASVRGGDPANRLRSVHAQPRRHNRQFAPEGPSLAPPW